MWLCRVNLSVPTMRCTVRIYLIWIILTTALLLMVTARFATPPNSTDPCTSNCTCMPNEMNCRGVIPYTVPEPIKTVVLTGLKPTDFSPARFCYVSWTNVKELIIESVLAVGLRYFHLEGRIFECLDQIETFRFSSGALYRVVDTTFSGLSNLNTFDLSGCKMLLWEDVASTLSVPSNFPNLKRLIFSQTGMHQLLVLDNEFIKALSLRPLEYLDLSFTLLNWDFSDPGKLCDTLTTLKYEGAQVLHSKEFANCSVCQSLRILDSGDKFYKNLIQNVTCKNAIQYFRPISPFFNDMQVLYMNNIVTPAEMYSLRNCIWVLWPHTQLTELHFAHNYLPNFDVELYNTKLETLNLGHNQMKSVGRKAFRFLVSLETLDLSDNILGQSQAMFDTFSTLFSRNANLTNLDLSGNLITSLPSATFATNTNLEHLVLADNLLEQVRLNMSQLVDLKILDLKDNSIKSLNKASRDFLDELYEKQSQNHNGSFVQVLLDGNPFDCSCDSLDFVYWFAESPMFISTRHKYFCSSNDQQVTMDGDAINAATEDCARIKRRRLMIQLLSTLTPAAMIATIIALLVCHRRRKIMLLRKRFRDGIQKLREDFSRFPVFVSYSSDDAELAKSQILRTFQSHLESMTGLGRDLVCNADLHFHPARTILSEIFRCLKVCDVFVALVSKNYCKSRYCRYEIEHAHLLQLPIILIFIEQVPEENMDLVTKEVFDTFTRVQLVLENGEYKLQPGWQQLCESVIQLL